MASFKGIEAFIDEYPEEYRDAVRGVLLSERSSEALANEISRPGISAPTIRAYRRHMARQNQENQ